jgi:hypothetical protein
MRAYIRICTRPSFFTQENISIRLSPKEGLTLPYIISLSRGLTVPGNTRGALSGLHVPYLAVAWVVLGGRGLGVCKTRVFFFQSVLLPWLSTWYLPWFCSCWEAGNKAAVGVATALPGTESCFFLEAGANASHFCHIWLRHADVSSQRVPPN